MLLRLGPEEHVLLLTMHHIVADGWSVGILFRELAALYESLVHGQPSPLPELPIRYADYAAWQQGWLDGPSYREQLAYWREQLDGAASRLDLPTDRPREALKTHRGERHFLRMPRALRDDLASLSRRSGVTLYMGLLAAFKALLHRYTGQTDIAIGVAARGTESARDRGLDRVLQQHAGAPHRPLGRPVLQAVAGAGTRSGPGPMATRTSPLSASSGSCNRAATLRG